MGQRRESDFEDDPVSRRGSIRGAAVVGSGLLGCGVSGQTVYAEALTREQRDKMTADEIIALMKAGNERFRQGLEPSRDFLAEQRAANQGQFPAAIVLSCIDSRAPAEVVMDLGIGDVFNARVAGNIANNDILGSMEFACQVAGAKVILVLGHTACGAIMGAIDEVELGHLTGLLARIQPAVAATVFAGERTAKNPAFVDAVARTNVKLTMASIREQSRVLRQLESEDQVKIAGAIYDLETARVELLA